MTKTSTIPRGGFSPERLAELYRARRDRGDRRARPPTRRGSLRGYHRLEGKKTQIPMRRDTIFRIASMTKPMIAVAALTLVEEGRIRLYDPVDAWPPELANRMVCAIRMARPTTR